MEIGFRPIIILVESRQLGGYDTHKAITFTSERDVVNSRSRLLHAIARPSVVCNIRAPYSAG